MPAEIELDFPKVTAHGDVASNIAMKLSKQLGMPPIEAAEKIVGCLQGGIINTPLCGKVAKIMVKPPGFINIFLTKFALYEVIRQIQSEKDKYGRDNFGKAMRLNIEFVSANPTGPLSVAHGRQAAVGDSLAAILKRCGFKVTKEYFINDEGRQMNLLGQSIYCRYMELLGKEADFPQDGYKGAYIYDIAKEIIKKYKGKYAKPQPDAFFRKYGLRVIMNIIRKELSDFGVKFDAWTSQARLTKQGAVAKTFTRLKKDGYIYEKDGAAWFKSTAFGDDKDRVVVKTSGDTTYLAPDIAYHNDKYARGFRRLINIWGPDHHGYIPRIKAAVAAMGFDQNSLDVIIVQLATLYRGKEVVPMSTRLGEFVTLRQVMEEVGRDAARFFFVSRRTASHLDFDIELAKKHSQENPVYYVQYAHARISSILEFAKGSARKGAPAEKKTGPGRRLKKLDSAEELELMKVLGRFPAAVSHCGRTLDPSGIAAYLLELAGSFHSFYDKHRVVSEDALLTEARLLLVDCVRIVLANGLRLLGVSAPSKM